MTSDWNPVLLKELRPWLRHERLSYRLFGVAFVAAFGLVFCLVLKSFASGISRGVGQIALLVLGFMQWMLCAQAIVPAATSITVEREKHTFEGLISSPLRPEGLVRGKVLFPVYVTALAQLALAPVMVAAYLLGGITLEVVPLFLVLLLLHDFFLASAGVYFSTLPHRPPRLAGSVMQTTMTKSQLAQQKAMGLWVAMVIPAVYTMIGITTTAIGGGGLPGVVATALELVERLKVLGSFIPVLALTVREPMVFFGGTLSFWIPAIALHALLAALYYRLAIGMVKGRHLDEGPGVRWLCGIFTHTLFFLLMASLWPSVPADAPLAVYAFVIAAGTWTILILLPALTSGDALPEDREGRWANVWGAFIRPGRMLRHRIGSTPAYLLALILPLAVHATLLAGQAPGASAVRLVALTGVVAGSTILGWGLFGISCSVRRRTGEGRGGAGGWLWTLAVAGLALPYIARMAGTMGSLPPFAQAPLHVVAAVAGSINPFCGLFDAADRSLGSTSPILADLAALTGPLPVPVWGTVVAANLMVGAIGWLRLRGDWAEPPPEKEESTAEPAAA